MWLSFCGDVRCDWWDHETISNEKGYDSSSDVLHENETCWLWSAACKIIIKKFSDLAKKGKSFVPRLF